MIRAGDTFDGYDEWGHLYIVVSGVTDSDSVALVG